MLAASILASSLVWRSLTRPSFDQGDLYRQLPQFKDAPSFDLTPPAITPAELNDAVQRAVRAVRSADIRYERNSDNASNNLAQAIKAVVIASLPKRSATGPSMLVQEWAIAEGICEWVKRNVRYDYELAGAKDTNEKSRRSQTASVLELGKSECWGFAVATRDLARLAGLSCYLANGHYRTQPVPPHAERNHSVVVFVFGESFQVPADVTSASGRYHGRGGIAEFGGPIKTLSHYVLPRDTWAWNYFLSTFNSDVILSEKETISGDVQNRWLRITLPYSQWAQMDVSSVLKRENDYISFERRGRIQS
jgi:hypothetical protein